ncbi:ATPase involved in DNA repair [Hahella chejuensis KCTC 2396]|uniref:ATPase involved in DNA repair n=1 Tax=Hahella chejuensis (strain KCTC 2396) TaxID=349521 RepID=Q2S6R5_HAHCH|nr:DNA sulfur modification protein DndD [Hahella chejuensis]ABC33659.1 ATPase involved in DNA repair [Hahella chejuensis KCTC 2396]
MILKSLYLQNFGVFQGSFDDNHVDLEPRVKYNRKRPIILFGGLNGAGKTTTLTAIRLALYGKQSLGRSVSVQIYHQFLVDAIHKPKGKVLAPNTAGIKLDFNFGRQGEVIDYTVERVWTVRGKSVFENVEIYQNDEHLKSLTDHQKQAFLNELIPIGVADLFFFDGEKIADLAEDNNNSALADAINRLLGLDIIDRLKADLGVYLRDRKRDKLPSAIQKEMEALENSYKSLYSKYQSQLADIEALRIESTELETTKERLNQIINDLGGAWASNRQEAETKEKMLRAKRNELQVQIRNLIADAAPLALATNQIAALLKQLTDEQQSKRQLVLQVELRKQLNKIQSALIKSLGKEHKKAIETSIEESLPAATSIDTNIIHDISDSEFNRLNHLITKVVPEQQAKVKALSSELEEVEEELAHVGLNISRAPDERRISNFVSELGEIENSLGQRQVEIKQRTEAAKATLREAMDSLRKLREKEKEFGNVTNLDQAVTLADRTRGLLESFSSKSRETRINTLEQEFIKSFAKLARKDDLMITAKIDPETFSVSLIDGTGHIIDKKKLSAGEKQIYAIAMLEALGRTSGRNLPIIIDTPLGRLDSHHRENLVKNYFPTASHQVLILSTDTEVDEDFYKELSPEISHAFEVAYDPEAGSSVYYEGYFWRH